MNKFPHATWLFKWPKCNVVRSISGEARSGVLKKEKIQEWLKFYRKLFKVKVIFLFNRPLQLVRFVAPFQTTWCSLEIYSFVSFKINYSYARKYLRIWKQRFSRVPSRGLKWGNKTYKLKRSIPLRARVILLPIIITVNFCRAVRKSTTNCNRNQIENVILRTQQQTLSSTQPFCTLRSEFWNKETVSFRNSWHLIHYWKGMTEKQMLHDFFCSLAFHPDIVHVSTLVAFNLTFLIFCSWLCHCRFFQTWPS